MRCIKHVFLCLVNKVCLVFIKSVLWRRCFLVSSPGVNVSGEPPPGILIFAQSWKKLNSTFGKMKKGMKGEKETTPAEQVLMSYEKKYKKAKTQGTGCVYRLRQECFSIDN